MCCIVGIWQLQVSPWNSPEKVTARAREHFEPWIFSTLFGRHQPNKCFLNRKTSGWRNFTPFSFVKYPFPFWNLWPLRYLRTVIPRNCFIFVFLVLQGCGGLLGLSSHIVSHSFGLAELGFFHRGSGTKYRGGEGFCEGSLSWGKGFPFLQGRSTGWSRCYEKIDRNDERILVFKGNLREGWVGLEVWGKLAVNLSYICRIFVCHHW